MLVNVHSCPVPDGAKRELKRLVCGDFVSWLRAADNNPIALLMVSPEVFQRAFSINRLYLNRWEFTAPPEENNYGSAECFLTSDGLAGFAITANGWLISVYSNLPWKGFLRTAAPFMKHATKLVCIVGGDNTKLVDTYGSVLGFSIIARTDDDTAIMTEYYGKEFIEDFTQKHGWPHHVFMCRSKPVGSTPTFYGYFDAEAYVDKEVL